MTDFGGKTSIFSHPVYLFLRKFSLQDSRGGSVTPCSQTLCFPSPEYPQSDNVDNQMWNFAESWLLMLTLTCFSHPLTRK
ncbi:hypothetical protein D3H37_06300 [Proteus mirabilis]|nr:hypothetical protein D3H37_06300 [Proteus mirabilis]UWZ67102.1 hypothetical protein D1J70_18425 [Proteus mirabilis]